MLKLSSRDTPSAEKIRDFLGIFPKGGGSSQFPKLLQINQNFCKLTKIILMCQKMFYNSGEVISDQFNHITLDSKSGKFWKNRRKQEVLDFFPLRGGGGSPIPKSICHNSYQKVNTLMKTKNAPKGLKCKIKHIFRCARLASLGAMIEINSLIHVFEIASIRALPCSRLLH